MEVNYICKKCGEILDDDKLKKQEVALKQGGFHLKASCPSCNNYIKFLPHSPPKFFFGKYKGKFISEVAKSDPTYLRWLLSEKIKPRLASDIKEALCQKY